MAGLNLTIGAGKVPFGTPLPGDAQSLANFFAQYGLINGTANFNGLNYGASTPAPANRGIPWFKTDQFGNPIGFFSWNGLAWSAIPVVTANGSSINRPSNPGIGTEYFDTTIGAVIIYTLQGWSTASGSVGDVKEVQAVDIGTALTNNPGWAQDTISIGLVVGAAGPATGLTAPHVFGQILGEENHILTVAEMPAHTHTISANQNNAAATGNVGNPSGILSDHSATATGSAGGGAGHNNLPPIIYYWRLVKQF